MLLEENFQIYTKPLKQNGLRKLEVSRWKAKLEAIRYMISKSDGSCLTVTGWANYRQCHEYNSYTFHGPYQQTDNQFVPIFVAHGHFDFLPG